MLTAVEATMADGEPGGIGPGKLELVKRLRIHTNAAFSECGVRLWDKDQAPI
jgi:hypothetical protein